jgi:hypothetical protein
MVMDFILDPLFSFFVFHLLDYASKMLRLGFFLFFGKATPGAGT